MKNLPLNILHFAHMIYFYFYFDALVVVYLEYDHPYRPREGKRKEEKRRKEQIIHMNVTNGEIHRFYIYICFKVHKWYSKVRSIWIRKEEVL